MLAAQVKILETGIGAQLAAHPDAHIFTSLPRAGTLRAARLLAEIGDCRSRFPDPQVAGRPGRGRPGHPPVRHAHLAHGFRWAVSRQLRDAVCDFADDSRHASPWAAAVYDAARARGKDHPHAVRILARAWIIVIWRCWQDGTAYDPAKHNALQRILDRQRRPGSRQLPPAEHPVTAAITAALRASAGRPLPRRSRHRAAHQPRRLPVPRRLRRLRAHRHQHQRRHHPDGPDRLGRRASAPCTTGSSRSAAANGASSSSPPASPPASRSPCATPSPAWTTGTCNC